MRSPYEDFVAATVNEDNKNSAIPYHARENSLPFSYGQINNKTSQPLRNGGGGAGGGAGFGANATDFNFNLNSERERDRDRNYGYNYSNNNSATTATSTLSGSGTDAKMIKAQPRLTSPLLVRKTLNSRSPTRNTTNTIANTYHYSYGNSNGFGSPSNGNSSSTLRKTPTRNDFEELLRERREKVYNEYRSTAQSDLQLSSSRQSLPYTSTSPPQPPQRQPQLSLTSDRGQTAAVRSNANGSGQSSKYNFDFEFNLNLDDLPPPRRANTMERDRSSSLQQYRTRDIPVAGIGSDGGAYVERNYHTISSSNAIRETTPYGVYQQHQQQQQQQQQERERPPLEVAYNRRFQQQSLQQQTTHQQPQQQQTQQQQQRLEYTAYGNGNASGYGGGGGYNNEYEHRGSLGGARSRRDLSPIYATTTKQQQQQQHQHQVAANSTMYRTTTTTTTEPELSITDYPSAAMASPSATLVSRPETPAFPVTPRTPYGASNGYNSPSTLPHNATMQRVDFVNGNSPSAVNEIHNYSAETIYQTHPQHRQRLNSSLSVSANSEPQEVAPHLVKFAKDSSKFWYKATLSREEAISLLLNAPPGTFVVRDSTTYKNAYGLVVRVSQPPPGSSSGKPDELVRHFLIEPTTRGVRLKGCANEPVFTSLSALVYEHSIHQLALPCLLRIPEQDIVPPLMEHTPAQKQLLTQGAACNVLWLYSSETESLTGEEAIRKAIRQLYAQKPQSAPTEVHFKVSQQGITLTDNTRKKFFRKHYAADIISFCDIDPDNRLWTMQEAEAENNNNNNVGALKKTIFAFVARRSASSKDNQCHVFCDLDISQPALAIVAFVNKTLPTEKQRNNVS